MKLLMMEHLKNAGLQAEIWQPERKAVRISRQHIVIVQL